MKKEIYILWNKKDDRPAIKHEDFGALVCYLTLEQTQANFETYFNLDLKAKLEIKKVIITDEIL